MRQSTGIRENARLGNSSAILIVADCACGQKADQNHANISLIVAGVNYRIAIQSKETSPEMGPATITTPANCRSPVVPSKTS